MEFLVRHGLILMNEELLYNILWNLRENYKELSPIIYTRRSEPVRVGTFRTLLQEALFKIYGGRVEPCDAVVHGILREAELRKSTYSARLNIGIDYVLIIQFPNNNSNVTIPLFIVFKSNRSRSETNVEKSLDKAIEEMTSKLPTNDEGWRKIRTAVKNVKRFTRIVYTELEAFLKFVKDGSSI